MERNLHVQVPVSPSSFSWKTRTLLAFWLHYYFHQWKRADKHQEIMTLGLMNMLAECESLSSKTHYYSSPATHGIMKLSETSLWCRVWLLEHFSLVHILYVLLPLVRSHNFKT